MALITKPIGAIVSDGPSWLKRYFMVSTPILWVDSVSGSDTNDGTNPAKPKATIFGGSGAHSVAVSGDATIIIVYKTHRESISGFSMSKSGVTLVSLGTGGTDGTDRAQITVSSAMNGAISLLSDDVRIENFYFPRASVSPGSLARIGLSSTGGEIRDCQFDIGTTDLSIVNVSSGAGAGNSIRGCKFKVGSDVTSVQANCAGVTISAAGTLVEDCTFDGGTVGFGSSTTAGGAFVVSLATADRFRIRNATLNNYSVGRIPLSGTKGVVDANFDATSRLDWTE
jgi:hypothetical protein